MPNARLDVRQIGAVLSAALRHQTDAQVCILRSGTVAGPSPPSPVALPSPHCVVVPPVCDDLSAIRGDGLHLVRLPQQCLDEVADVLWDTDVLTSLGLRGSAGRRVRLLPLDDASHGQALQVISQLQAEGRHPGGVSPPMLRVKLAELLLLVHGGGSVRERHGSPPRGDISAVMAYIRGHYADQFRLEQLAEMCGLSPDYFSRAFSQAAGVPPFTFISRVRIDAARRLLKRSTTQILEIAYAVGFNNVSHFNRAFRRVTGMSPREYRRHVRG